MAVPYDQSSNRYLIKTSQAKKLAMAKRSVASVSFDMGLMEVDEERLKTAAAQFFRGRLAARTMDPKKAETGKRGEDGSNESMEPDWSEFESAFASDLYPKDEGYTKTVQFLTEVVDLLIDYTRKVNDRSSKILDFHHPHQLKEALGHCLDIPDTPRDLEQVLSDCKETLKYGVKTGHPRFFNQLSSGLDIIALAGEWLTATANTNMFTYEIAPVFTLMEEVTLQRMREHIGWSDGDGIFAPGGAISNLYAVMAARFKKFPELKTKGMHGGPQLALFTSEHAHYSIKQAAAVTGIGTENVFQVKTDKFGKILPEDLSKKINEALSKGLTPLLVSATAGTTVLGAFDPLNDIADICEEHDLWMHVDAAWGGGVMLSKRHSHLVRGISRANSVTWNPHKVMGVTLQCSAILLHEKGILSGCNSMHATYLFQQDKQYDMRYDTGDKAIQCGRHNDVFKLWLMWRAKGDEGFEEQINNLFEMSEHLQAEIKRREGFEFVMDKPEYLNVCFWYIPKKFRKLGESEDKKVVINSIAPKVKAKMMEAGTTMVGYQPLDEFPNFFRMVISNPAAKPEDIDFLLDEIERFGEEL